MASFIVSSGKGGVGKTQTVINLGTALSQFGGDVTIVDGNLPVPDISLYFSVPFETNTLNDVIRGKSSVEDATYEHESGLKVIPANINLNSLGGITQDDFTRVLKQLKKRKTTLIIDSAPGLGAEFISAARSADHMFVVTNPELPALSASYKTIQMAESIGVEVAAVVLNRVGRYAGEPNEEEIRDIIGDHPIRKIPEDPAVPTAALMAQPVVTAFPKSPAAIGFKKIAAEIMGVDYKEKFGVMDWVHRIIYGDLREE
ncbi:cell division ATPase MinD [Candidatus Micrarchaeota archaeon]|nr:cell division ATPase MinD [Candidatus Micrarchaeota archaeon]